MIDDDRFSEDGEPPAEETLGDGFEPFNRIRRNAAAGASSARVAGDGSAAPEEWSCGDNTLADIRIVLRDHPDWKGVLGCDLFSGEQLLHRPIPGTDEPADNFSRALKSADENRVRLHLQEAELIKKPSATNVRDAIEVVCEDNGADPLIDYLDGLSWDGIERLDGWLTTYCAVTDTAYTRAVGRCWLIAAVARQYEPGCKVDTMLILEGPQGIGKSTALSILAVREAWFLDHLTKLSDKDSQQGLTGRWIVEMSELAALKKAKGEELKAFLSRQTDKFRPAYGRRVEQRPRRCVFAGTTNEAEYLKDTTGNRRLWPVRCDGPFDLEALARDRDQLWAEAVAAYKAGEGWTLPTALEEDAAAEQKARVIVDPLEAPIRDYLDKNGLGEVTVPQLFDHVTALSSLGRTQETSRRIGAILRGIGWEQRGHAKRRDSYRDQRRWVRPDPA